VIDSKRALALTALLTLTAPVFAQQRDDLVQNKYLPPEVGAIAPPIGGVHWLQVADEDAGVAPEIESLRGHVVIVQSWGHYCDP